jgi:hypothetical protein
MRSISGPGGADVLTLGTGSVIVGDIAGEGSASQIMLTGTGTLASDIVGFGPGSALSLAQGAEWVASGNWTVASVVNGGTLQPGLVGAPLNLTGRFAQLSTGTLRVVVTPSGVSQFNVTGPAWRSAMMRRHSPTVRGVRPALILLGSAFMVCSRSGALW